MYLSRVFFSSLLIVSIAGCGGGGGGGGTPSSTNPPVDDGSGNNGGGDNDPGTGGGETPDPVTALYWEGGNRISAESIVSSNPSVIVNSAGTVFATWLTHKSLGNYDSAVNALVVRAGTAPGAGSVISSPSREIAVSYGWGSSVSNPERFRPGTVIAADGVGSAHIGWVDYDGAERDIRVSTFDPDTSTWGAAATIDNDDDSFEPQLFAFSSGIAYVVFKQATVDGTKLLISKFDGGWGAPVEVDDVKTGVAVSGWIVGATLNIAYVDDVDSNNDSLKLATVSETTGLVGAETVDSAGLKSDVQGIEHNGEKVIVWSERDIAGFYSLIGKARNSVWYDLPKIEELPNHSQHVQLASLDGVLHIVWDQRYSMGTSQPLFDDVLTTRLDEGVFSAIEKLYDSGAANPTLVKADGMLYLEWYASHSNYSEYHPGTGWLNSSKPFCYGDLSLGEPGSGTCYNSGQQHALSVNGVYGANVWVQSISGIQSVILSLSN